MRAIVLGLAAIPLFFGLPAFSQSLPAAQQAPHEAGASSPARENCARLKRPADQMICGDAGLQEMSQRLAAAIQSRMVQLSFASRPEFIEDNAEWFRNRDSSCGIFGNEDVPAEHVPSVKACLLEETKERIAILTAPNVDCLTAKSAARLLICSDPPLAEADRELNGRLLGMIAKLREGEARAAFDEKARWMRARNRKCRLETKDNMPLDELSSSKGCLAEWISQKKAEVVAANGDPRRIFGRHVASPSPDADAIEECVAQIQVANTCGDFLSIRNVNQIDSELSDQDAVITAAVELTVLSPFAICSPVALGCTGKCWDPTLTPARNAAPSKESFAIAQRLIVKKPFKFVKAEAGWRCNTLALQPTEAGHLASGSR